MNGTQFSGGVGAGLELPRAPVSGVCGELPTTWCPASCFSIDTVRKALDAETVAVSTALAELAAF